MLRTSRASLRYVAARCGLCRGTCVHARQSLMHGALAAVRFIAAGVLLTVTCEGGHICSDYPVEVTAFACAASASIALAFTKAVMEVYANPYTPYMVSYNHLHAYAESIRSLPGICMLV